MSDVFAEEYYRVPKRLAAVLGEKEAIFISEVKSWIDRNKKKESEKNQQIHFRDGKWWMYNSFEVWEKIFPMWSISTIFRIVDKLRKKGFLVVHSFKKSGTKKTNWYALNENLLNEYVDAYFVKMTKCSEAKNCQNEKIRDDGILSNWQNTESVNCQNEKIQDAVFCQNDNIQYTETYNTESYSIQEHTSLQKHTSIDSGNLKEWIPNDDIGFDLDLIQSQNENKVSDSSDYVLGDGNGNYKNQDWRVVAKTIREICASLLLSEENTNMILKNIKQYFKKYHKAFKRNHPVITENDYRGLINDYNEHGFIPDVKAWNSAMESLFLEAVDSGDDCNIANFTSDKISCLNGDELPFC